MNGQRTEVAQHFRLFRIYLVYRTLLSLVLILLLVMPATRQLVGSGQQLLYAAVSVLFLLSNLLLVLAVAVDWAMSNLRLVLLFCVDIGCLTLLSDASGGMASGLPLLLTVSVAASAVLLANRTLATLVAALAVLALLADTLWLVSNGVIDLRALLPAGLLGALFFAVSGIVQLIVLRLRRAEAIATARASDIQRLQRLNEEIVRRLQSGVLLVDRGGEVQLLNEAARRLLEPPRGTGRPAVSSVRQCGRELARRLEDFRRGGEPSGSPFYLQPGGAQVLARIASIDGDSTGQLLLFLDDYAPVVARAQALKLRSLGRLAGSIAHEIRNPLGAISHAAQLLQESPTIGADDQRMLDMVLTNSQRVNEIVESVLQVSRREPPRPTLIALAEWLPEFRAQYREATQPGELQLEYVDTSARIRFDAEHLQRILGNLVENAMRHSQQATGNPRAELRARVDHERRECIIEVFDDGAGVAEADLPRLFEPFFTRSRQGSGLGLYLCRELCELNQARIAYAPGHDGRSRFRITAPQQE